MTRDQRIAVGDTVGMAFAGVLAVVGAGMIVFAIGVALVDWREADAECARRHGVWAEVVVLYTCVEPAREPSK